MLVEVTKLYGAGHQQRPICYTYPVSRLFEDICKKIVQEVEEKYISLSVVIYQPAEVCSYLRDKFIFVLQ